MSYLYRTFLLVLLVVCSPALYGQNAPAEQTISGSFTNTPLSRFIGEIESKTTYRFYFDPATIDSVQVNLQLNQTPVPAALAQALEKTNLKFATDNAQRVYITPGKPLSTELPTDFFKTDQAETVATAEETTPTEAIEDKNRFASTSELKLYKIGVNKGAAGKAKATLAGHLRDNKTGEPVVGAALFIESPAIGTTTDQFGYYSLTLPVGRHDIKIRGIGIKNTKRQVALYEDGKLEIEVEEDITPLREVIIEAEKDKNVAGMQMGLEKLDIKTMRQVPSAFGETDILRVVLTLPGVKSVGEGSTGLNVRGGAADQNLILFNDAIIYNPSHLFGFFSAFNPDILKGVELYKSAIPAKYGGRLSSVLDITTREGNKKKLSGSGGIGPLTSRFTLEGPILKDRTSFILGGRLSYSDWILHQLPSKTYKQSSASFYDFNLNVSHTINDKNTLYAMAYVSNDRFKLSTDTVYRYANQAASLKWNHIFSNKFYGVLSGAYSRYAYQVSSEKNPVNASELRYQINQSSLKADFNYFLNNKHTLEFGASSILYGIEPGSLRPVGNESLIKPDILGDEQGLESALYISDRIDVTPRFSVSLGLRYSLYNSLGPKEVYQYIPSVSKTVNTIIDTVSYKPGQITKTYHGPEYRVSLKYALSDNSSVKASYNRTRQYIHMLSNTTSMSPTDIWKLSDTHIRPQIGDQVALGYYRNFKSNTIETSVEAYYKDIKDFVDYKSGATILLNHHIETDVVNAHGHAYGVEVMVKKLTGKVNGWVSYTYSRSLLQVNSGTTSDMINGGKYYPSNFDRPHDFTMIGNYRFSRRISSSLNLTYSTGRPITLPLAKYNIGSSTRVYYSERNAYRVPDYYRADLAFNIEGNHKVKKLAHGSWTLGVYNLTGRKNPFSIYFKSEKGRINGYQLSIFGQPIPTVTYNFKF
ncbi:TonB-dependent receptor [Hymenobacter metallicola]|uniref:TonB-dependent receptor n=1 Tax=Hymenobacter metallicola TaxID=2563114 RepID=A0A4Z0QKC3_9BACT|nr:carboxypeptidase-like regulatory domain-containing protein [Hymenobacter metallicola]TGE29481.1 TonB-dependent receptor [Hymenobacter metallicola]